MEVTDQQRLAGTLSGLILQHWNTWLVSRRWGMVASMEARFNFYHAFVWLINKVMKQRILRSLHVHIQRISSLKGFSMYHQRLLTWYTPTVPCYWLCVSSLCGVGNDSALGVQRGKIRWWIIESSRVQGQKYSTRTEMMHMPRTFCAACTVQSLEHL